VVLASKGNEQLISTEFDVITHHRGVHSNRFDWKSVSNKFHFDVDCTADNINDGDLGRRLIIFEYRRHAKLQWRPSSQLISLLLKHNPGIKPRFLSQKIAQKDLKKKMPFDSCKCNHVFCEAGSGRVAPFDGSLCFVLNAWYCFDGA
jgi:hypothetical protein